MVQYRHSGHLFAMTQCEEGYLLGPRKTLGRDGQVDSESDISVCWVAKASTVKELKLADKMRIRIVKQALGN